MLDGHANVKALFEAAAEQGMPALAITDHGNLFGAFDFYKAGKDVGVKPIIGLEGYYLPVGSRHDRGGFQFEGSVDGNLEDGGATPGKLNYTHMTLWSETTQGMQNLFRISSLSWLEGQYSKWPRFDRELLDKYGTGLIGTTGCPSGEVQRWLQVGQYDRAKAAAADYRDIFGEGNFFVEVMDHGIEIERRVQADLLRLAKELAIPLVATNDLHYVRAQDAIAHDALLCIQTAADYNDPKRFRFDSQEFYLKTAAQMRHIWRDHPEAAGNTLLIAERCNVEFFEGRNLMPRFPVPEGMTEDSLLAQLVQAGLLKRFAVLGKDVIPPDYLERAAFELSVISQMGFSGYFLVVSDLVQHAKEVGIRVGPGRGSAAGALIAWALEITGLDPIKHGLLFERFLNPERVSMPDIDMDFDDRRRSEMIRYATEKYGEERVAQIITYSTIKSKAAVKDSARILSMPYSIGEEITKTLPPAVMGKDVPLSGIFDPKHERYGEAADFRNLYAERAEVKQVVDIAIGIEGARRQWGVHAAGVILSAEPLLDLIPLIRRAQDGAVITQFDHFACEKLGLLKMDFLGLRNLTVLDDTLMHIKRNRGIDIVLEELELDDKPTYELLARGDTLGVFQLDSPNMRSLLRSLMPTSFDDISAVLALYRPGPMGENAHNDYADRKNGRKPVEPIHPELEAVLQPILGDTYGVIVYQEQVMAVAQQLADYSLGQADLLRRAMGKKDKKILKKEYVPFSQGMAKRNFSPEATQRLWDVLVPFADYAFNKSHSAAYGVVSYWTGYLKANYPSEYMAALLSSVKEDRDKLGLYLNECRRMDIKVLPPDVNESLAEFSPIGKDIRFGMTAIKNVGLNVVESLIATREKEGRFVSFVDFLNKVDMSVCNKRLVESLIKAGAFDTLGNTRKGLFNVHLEAVDSVLATKRQEAAGMTSLFDDFLDTSPESDELSSGLTLNIVTDEWPKDFLLAQEREMLGLYVSDHPLLGIEHVLKREADMNLSEVLTEVKADEMVNVAGLITSVTRRTTKAGKQWAAVTLEDLDASCEVMVFPQSYPLIGPSLVQDAVVAFRVKVDKREEEAPKLIAQRVWLPDITSADASLAINLTLAQCDTETVDRVKQVLLQYPGKSDVRFRIINGSRVTTVAVEKKFQVTIKPELYSDLKGILGAHCFGVK